MYHALLRIIPTRIALWLCNVCVCNFYKFIINIINLFY